MNKFNNTSPDLNGNGKNGSTAIREMLPSEAVSRALTVSVIIPARNEAETLDLRPRLPEIQVPTLVIVGRHDFITNVAMAEEMVKHIPTARLEIFEDSGHFASVEEPEKFYEVVRGFVFEG